VQKGVNVRGILPYVTKYETFSPSAPQTLQLAIQNIADIISLNRERQRNIAFAVGAGLAMLGLYLLITKK
jgi:hypothetical protein